MTPQSPSENDLKGSVGYICIYNSPTDKFELSLDGTDMIRTIYKPRETYLYERIDDEDTIRKVEKSGYGWKSFEGDRRADYIVKGQVNKEGRLTGHYKVAKATIERNWYGKIESITIYDRNWKYYRRRADNR